MEIELPRILSFINHNDLRGSFSRIFDSQLTSTYLSGTSAPLIQVNISINPTSGTLRGMHYQVSGPREDKYIRVLSGEIYLVVSNAHAINEAEKVTNLYFELCSEDETTIYVPSGWATGWLSRSLNTSILYMMTSRYEDCEYGGFRFDDPRASIVWPSPPSIVSEKDKNWEPIN